MFELFCCLAILAMFGGDKNKKDEYADHLERAKRDIQDYCHKNASKLTQHRRFNIEDPVGLIEFNLYPHSGSLYWSCSNFKGAPKNEKEKIILERIIIRWDEIKLLVDNAIKDEQKILDFSVSKEEE